jgi:hypothetical protein
MSTYMRTYEYIYEYLHEHLCVVRAIPRMKKESLSAKYNY